MKKYEVYRNIRKRAMIMGLPISLFALMMVSVIGSLLIIIFSFSFGVIVALLLTNALLLGALAQWVKNPQLLSIQKVFPKTISNKRLSPFDYA
jgi:type IV secretory pathway VirB3-like protein